MLRNLQIFAPVFMLISIALMGWYVSRPDPEVPPDLPEEVLEFYQLSGIRLDPESDQPVFRKKLKELDGKPVVIAGYMVASPVSEKPGDYRVFRLAEHAPGTLLRPLAANEAIFVERRDSEETGETNLFPLIQGAIAVRGILRLAGEGHANRGLEAGYWFAIEEAEIDPMGPP